MNELIDGFSSSPGHMNESSTCCSVLEIVIALFLKQIRHKLLTHEKKIDVNFKRHHQVLPE